MQPTLVVTKLSADELQDVFEEVVAELDRSVPELVDLLTELEHRGYILWLEVADCIGIRVSGDASF